MEEIYQKFNKTLYNTSEVKKYESDKNFGEL